MVFSGTILNGNIQAYCYRCDRDKFHRVLITHKSCNIECLTCHKKIFYRAIILPEGQTELPKGLQDTEKI
jgi:hypothetical protein